MEGVDRLVDKSAQKGIVGKMKDVEGL